MDGWLGGRVEVHLTAGGRPNHRRQRRHRVGIEVCTVGLLRHGDQRYGQHSHEDKHKHRRATCKSNKRQDTLWHASSCGDGNLEAANALKSQLKDGWFCQWLSYWQSGRACGAQRVAVEIALSFSGLSLSGAGAVRYSHETAHISRGWPKQHEKDENDERTPRAGNDGLGAFGYRGSWSIGRSTSVPRVRLFRDKATTWQTWQTWQTGVSVVGSRGGG